MMNYTPTELEAFVRKRAPEIAKGIQAAAKRARVEADLVAEVERVLERFARNFDVSLRLERERSLINGRADAVYNRFVIEYEPPGSLRKEKSARPNQHAVDQVKHYIEGLARMDRHRKERLAGVALDGHYFIFVRFRDGHWREDDPVPVSTHSTETFLRYLLSLSTELALTPENMVRDFGENTVVSRKAVSTLYNALRTSENPKVRILFHQWQRMFSEICGYEEGSTRLNVTKLAKSYGVTGRDVSALHLFFAIHTYYATFIKLLAVQIAHYYLMPKVGTGLAQVASADTQSLIQYLQKMEQGGVFADFGIKNFLEGDFFGWYLDAWDQAVENALRRVIGDLANYSLVTLDVDPEETRDLLKQLYQNLMPKKLRHDLGEYYTPDWLAERLLNQLCGGPRKGEAPTLDPGRRLLDPACGSGTFLVLTIKRMRQYADVKMLPPADVLEQVLQNVVGFDLNPLAVITARTNYLLALGDLLPYRRGEISIPVYLADSIMTPTAGADLFTQHAYSFNTAVGKFSVPRSLVEARTIDQLADLLEESVGMGLTPDQFQIRFLQTFPLDAAQDAAEVGVAVRLYEQLLDLDRQGINGIWARIIKNAFAPLFQGRFDYVAGNPPWVNWESLPDDYRREIAPLWTIHELFPHKGFDAILGKSKDDISVLMTYVALDKYVQKGRRLGFLITQSVFKTAGAGQGFRRFRLGNGTPLAVVHVDDMADLKPFEGASNRTTIFVLERGRVTKYPVPYTYWRKKGGGTTIPDDLSLEEAQEMTVRRNFVAQPVDETDPTSPWITGRPRALKAMHKVLGASDYQARAGVCTWLNGVYWLETMGQRPDGLVIISNITKGSKRKLEDVQAAIESNLLYPLLRGRDVRRWQATPSVDILITHEPGMGLKAIPEDEMAIRLPKTYAYLKHFKAELRSRSGYHRYFKETDPFYSVFNVGDYTFEPYKVVWARIGSSMTAAVVGMSSGKPIVPQETITLVAFEISMEAHYVCAVVNSAPFNFAAQSYSQKGGKSFGTPSILENIRVPCYDPASPIHRQLAALSQQTHEAAAMEDTAWVREIEAEIDRLAARLWGLTEEELWEIQESLTELG
jgi:SAM-dependent methyltransferase